MYIFACDGRAKTFRSDGCAKTFKTSKTAYVGHTKINNELLSVEMQKTSLVFDKPIYVEFSILDLSKHLMYQFC